MGEEICNPGDRMSWPPVRAVAEVLDGAAASLGIPEESYEPLLSREGTPFPLSDKESATVHLCFHLDVGGVVNTTILADDPFGDENLQMAHPELENLASAGELFFVTEPDACMCSHIFRVTEVFGGYSLDDPYEEENPGPVCCLTTWVPQEGDTLPGNKPSSLFPPNKVLSLLQGNPSSSTSRIQGVEACVEDGDGLLSAAYHSSDPGSRAALVSRKLNGFFTWRAKADYMDMMWDAVETILDCRNNGGSVPEFWKVSEDEFVPENCSPTVEEAVGSMAGHGEPESLPDVPGCMAEAPGKKPWEEPTCQGDECDEKPKFYCETLRQLASIAEALEQGLKAREESRVGCCCPVEVEYDLDVHGASQCGCYDFEGGEVCEAMSHEYGWECVEWQDDGTGASVPVTVGSGSCLSECSWTGIGTPGDILVGGEFVDCRGTFSEEGCPPSSLQCGEIQITSESAEKVDCIAMASCEDLNDAIANEVSEVSQGSVFSVECGRIESGRYRLVVRPGEGEQHWCTAESPKIEVAYEVVKMWDTTEESVGDTKYDELEWDASEEAFVGEWQDFPGNPHEPGMDFSIFSKAWWKFRFDSVGDQSKGTGCPRCFLEPNQTE